MALQFLISNFEFLMNVLMNEFPNKKRSEATVWVPRGLKNDNRSYAMTSDPTSHGLALSNASF